jgi:hypothetical protein
VCLNNAEISENGSDLSQKLKETQSKYEEAMKEVLSVQKQMKLGLVSPESVDTYSHLHELRITEEEMDVLKRDLQGALEEVKARTAHLKNVVIAVMGCIVNGPGEMADADWGYVGEGGGKVSIYRCKTPVLRHVPQEEAADRLLELIESEGSQGRALL